MIEPDGLAHELVGSATVIRLEGDIDADNADVLTTRAVALSRASRAVVLDLRATTYLDSAGVRLIDTLARECAPRGIPFAAFVPPESVIRRVVELTMPTLELIDDVRTWSAADRDETA
jgi:anti-sigma B factor antagonist